MRFATLASGSLGNAALVRADGAGLLIDVGLGPRALAERLESVGWDWARIGAVVLTHTHGDHVRSASLQALAKRRIPFICHEGHCAALKAMPGFRNLDRAGLVKTYVEDQPFLTPSGHRVEPITVTHDGGPTFGFRIEGRTGGRRGRTTSVGYLTDTGTWTTAMVEAVTDVEVLAVEFNHDVKMQLASGRSRWLIARILSDRGHLSNDQGAALLEAVLARSAANAIRDVVLLHLSRDCNDPAIASEAALAVVRRGGRDRRTRIHAACQFEPSPHLELKPAPRRATAIREVVGFPWEAEHGDGAETVDPAA